MSYSSESITAENSYEEQHVHQVYNSIASHFSSTRFKPWPVVDSFLRNLATGSIGLDIGCGNGKYLTVRDDVFIVGSDRSSELLKFAAQHQPHDVAVADTLNLPHPDQTFDFAISIAVVHHLSTRERRREAVQCILRTLKHGIAEALIFVWALEQKGSRRGWDIGDEQDVLVPWVLKNDSSKKKGKESAILNPKSNGTEEGLAGATTEETNNPKKDEEQQTEKTYQRYYHLYRKGELEEDVEAIGGTVVQQGYDRDNWWVICVRGNT